MPRLGKESYILGPLQIEALDTKEADAKEPPIPRRLRIGRQPPGDLWLLGRHKVLCDDARDEVAHAALMATESPAAVFTDLLYNVAVDGHVCGLGTIHHREFVIRPAR